MKKINLSILVAAILSSFSVAAQDASQSVFVTGSPKGVLGSPVSITVGYDVTDDDATLTGLGLRVHYNSSALEFVEFKDVLTTDNISSSGPTDDVDNSDGDDSTDKFITANWASLFGNWPGSLPSDLLTATFNVADDDSLESTVINFSASSNTAGYAFAPNAYTMDIISGSWDLDGNGAADALTDGLLLLRHTFNLRGDDLLNGAVSLDSPLTGAEIEANINAAYQVADIDNDGNVDALTDSLMLLRYMFFLRGDNLVDGAVAPEATRKTHTSIEQYIASYMPSESTDDTGSGDTGSGDTGSGDTGSGDTGSGDTGSGDTGSGDTGSGDTGSGDTGSGDTGSGDTGSGDTGSGDTGETTNTEKGPAEFTEAFGGTIIDGNLFTFSSAAEDWAGFANMDLTLYPFTFSAGGSITFTAAVPSGGSADVRFRFEKNPHPDVEPSYDTSTVTVTGATESSYSVDIPSQGNNAFRNLIMYVVDREVAVQVSNLMVTEASNSGSGDTGSGDTGSGDTGSGDTGSGDTGETTNTEKGPAEFTEAFGGTIIDGNLFTFSSAAEDWAGFANMDLTLYPFTFSAGGSITFTAAVPSGGSADVRFRFEKNPHPDVEPSYDTSTVTVTGATESSYSVDIPSQGNNAFRNLIMYVVDREVAVQVSNLMVTEASNSGSGDTGSGDTGSGTPGQPADGVISIFGDTYTNINVTDFNPYWEQQTQVTVGDVLTYANLNYQGTEFEAQDVSSKEFFHVDFYTDNASSLEMFVINSPGAETGYSLTNQIVLGQWVSVDIPLSAYDVVDLRAVNQLKVVGDGTVQFDNLYFHGSSAAKLPKNVTFSVNMSGIDLLGEVPTVQGTFNGWCGACNPMSDPDGDNIWSLTIELPEASYEYKYALGNWVSQENVPLNCVNSVGANRSFTINGDTVLATDAYNGCPGEQPTLGGNITFAVDMTGVDLGGEVPTLQGGFNNWCGDCAPLSDDNGDNVWTITTNLAGGEHQYKYALGAWVSDETVPENCANTIGANRSLNVTGDATNPTDVYNGCPSDFTGVTDPGADSGTGSGTGSASDAAEFIEAFGGATIGEGSLFTFPSGSEPWAGFANMNTSLYPISISSAGTLTFNASVPSGGSADVYFRFEKNPHPDVEPSFNTAYVTVTGSDTASYSVDLPSQGSNTFSSFLLYVVDQDIGVVVTDVALSADTGSGTDSGTDGDNVIPVPVYTPADGFVISESFGGTSIEDDSLFTFPAGADSWGGFANMNTSLYPISLSQASLITFTAAVPAGGSADVRFRFEKNPHPDVDPAFNTAAVTVTGDQAASYSISVPSQGNNVFRSFIIYLDTRDVAVEISDIVISVDPNGGDTGSGDTGSGDTGSGDTGSGDTGSGDTGSGDTDSEETTVNPPAEFVEAFGGTVINGNLFTYPASAEPWGGFANMRMDLYPLVFSDGGSVSFNGAVPSGGTATIKFRFEFKSHPDVDPAYNTTSVVVSGSTATSYTVEVPSQGGNTFSNFIFYITERDVPVEISDVVITSSGSASTGGSGGTGIAPPDDYDTLSYGAGSIGDSIYTSNHRCKEDWGYWVENAGVISTQSDVQAQGCNQSTGIPTGNITKLYPQLTGPAASKPTQTHKWWGSVSFLGEMTVGDADDSAYITPDPISARITNKGVRVAGIPSGLKLTNSGQYYYPIPDHAGEVFDGIAIGNSAYTNLEAYTKDYSEGSVTVMWKSGSTDVMEATFVHGSPYVYVKAYEGNLEVRTLRQDGVNEKGTFPVQSNMLGVWTTVAGSTNNFLIVGEGSTSFPDLSDSNDPMTMGTYGVINSAKEMTLVYLPQLTAGSVSSSMIDQFAASARNKVAAVDIDYAVDRSSNEITVTHSYFDDQGAAVDTLVGMHPLHWKNASQTPSSSYQIRSARGTIKFAELSEFSYQIPYVGVLPTLPTIDGSFDQVTLEGLVTEFVNQGSNTWNTSAEGNLYEDTYWSGKNYGKAAELAAIAGSIGMQDEADQLISWLKAELSDWFTAEADGELKAKKYFVYDSDWNTLLGFDEAYGSHQRLADHHFHYGYFVRAAAEICRVDLAWCGQDQYGPMIELLIRDYAADKDDPLFPHMRNFDPANGFSWADGKMNFIRGNNNESTSEAATAYGAIILYGLATGNTELTEKGMYLHASTGATFWEYWNNIDGYNNVSADADNFFPGYQHITTSIIWGDGVDFATWFSGAYAHILGIQGLPSSPLIFHVGIHPEYMEDYVDLGLSEASGRKPSGLVDDQWRDLWWNLWSMTDADAAIADYNTVSSYEPEQGESKAHTYHWIHTFKALGHLAMGTGELTSDHPAAVAFDKDGQRTYVVYNFTDQATTVTYSDGHTVNAAPLGFTID